MSEYKIIEDFQLKSTRILALDRSCIDDVFSKNVYIDGKKYKHIPNSVQSWILLPDVYESFEGKTVVFK